MRKIPALILIIVLVIPLILATLMAFSVSTWLLSRSFYRELLGDERLYDALLKEALRQKGRTWYIQPHEIPELEGIPADALAKALAEEVSAEYLRDQALALVDATFDAAEGRKPALELHLNVAWLKARLKGEARERFSRALAAALPVCSSGKDPVISGSGMLRCRPTDMSGERAAQLISSALPALLEKVPDHYPLIPKPVRLYVEPAARFWLGFVGTARLIWAAVILAVLAASFWIGAAFLGGRDRREITQFLGWSLFVPALFALLCGLAIRFSFLGRWLFFAPPMLFFEPFRATRELAQAVFAVTRTILHTISKGFLVTGAVSIGLALGLLAWSRSIEAER